MDGEGTVYKSKKYHLSGLLVNLLNLLFEQLFINSFIFYVLALRLYKEYFLNLKNKRRCEVVPVCIEDWDRTEER